MPATRLAPVLALTLTIAMALPVEAQSIQVNASEKAALLKMSRLEDARQLSGPELAELQTFAQAGGQATQAYALALLYKHDKPARQALLPRLQTAFSYQAPANPPISAPGDFYRVVERVSDGNPAFQGTEVPALLAYLYFKDQPLSFRPTEAGKPVAAATFMRSAFLRNVFAGSDVDTAEVVKALRADTTQ